METYQMSSPEKRDGKLTGFWYGEVDRRNKGGQRFRRRFETKREAEGYEAYVKATGFEPENLKDAKLGQTFAEASSAWKASNTTWKRGRDKPGQDRLEWITGRIGTLAVSSITTATLDAVVRDLEKRPAKGRKAGGNLSPATINRYLSAASGVLSHARVRDPKLPGCEVPWKHETGHRRHWLSDAQEASLVRWLTQAGYLAEALTVRVLCASGLRWGEFSSVDAYACQGEWIKLDKTKTDTPRDVPIPEDLNAEFCAMIRLGERPNYTPMRRHLKAAVKACGYAPELGIHNLRHTLASRLIQDGQPLSIVKDYLGHADIKTTEKYVHVEKQSLLNAMRNRHPRRGETGDLGASEVIPFPKKSTG
jgi:integrase